MKLEKYDWYDRYDEKEIIYAKEHKELLEDIVGYIKSMNLHELRTLADVMASEGWFIYEK